MLKNIPANVSADLIKLLMDMGHGDELLIADANFPAYARPAVVVDCIGQNIPELLDSILSLISLDQYAEHPTVFMQVLPGDPYVPKVLDVYREIGFKHEEKGLREEAVSKAEFYEKIKNCYAVITTSEKELYANLIIKKGVL